MNNATYMNLNKYYNMEKNEREDFDKIWEIAGYSDFNKSGTPATIEFRRRPYDDEDGYEDRLYNDEELPYEIGTCQGCGAYGKFGVRHFNRGQECGTYL